MKLVTVLFLILSAFARSVLLPVFAIVFGLGILLAVYGKVPEAIICGIFLMLPGAAGSAAILTWFPFPKSSA